MALRQVIHIAVLFLLSQMFNRALSQQCTNGGSEASILGWKLQRHIYKTLMANLGHECVLICRRDDRCQSFNWVISLSMCEFSDRTKEARPEDFVPDPDRYYFRRDMNRVPLGSIPELPAETCKEIKASEGQAVSKKYWLSTIKPGIPVFAHCDMKTEDVDECSASSPVCDVHALCTNTRGSYLCSCKVGFSGDGKACQDINECSISPSVCDVNADCQNNEGSYVCSCRPGFTGNGKACRDINECSVSPSVCHINANCQNNAGSYICSCKPGFTGDGKTCKDINECMVSQSTCHTKAYCMNTEGSYICSCKDGYKGDGKSCTGTALFATASSSCVNVSVITRSSKSGIIFSNKDGTYSHNVRCQWTLSSNTNLNLVFFRFGTETFYDRVYVYDGGSALSPLIGTFNGTSLPKAITSTSNKLFVTFNTDGSITNIGFAASYHVVDSVRLVHGSTPLAGKVEIFYNNQWGTICDDGWDINDANVICRQLGFPTAARAFRGARQGRGSGPFWIKEVTCTGKEAHIKDCSHRGCGKNDCTHSKDVSVECSSRIP